MRRRREAATVGRPTVEGVEVVLLEGSSRLLTLRSGDPIVDVLGAIVRFVPAAADSAEDRVRMKDVALRAGARHVWLAPAEAAAAVVSERPSPIVDAAESPRAVIEKMVEDSYSRNRELLREVVGAALAKVGL